MTHYTIDREAMHMADLDFDYHIEQLFGPDVSLVTNMDMAEKTLILETIQQSDVKTLFVDTAYIIGGKPDESMFGLYTNGFEDLSDFWALYREKKKTACTCGNTELGFNCVCDHVKSHPGNTEYTCEFCGIYTASTPNCNKWESSI
jgi:hypothetical protein